MTKSILFFYFLFFFSFIGFSQTQEANLEKYWAYRARFLGENGSAGFVDVGIGPGKSLPISGRNPRADCQNDYFITHSGCDRHTGKGLLHWVDATVFLGYYIALLATEYRNLKYSNASTQLEVTKYELYCALKAVERLDGAAEVALGLEPAIDGFFIRDDVPSAFYEGEKERMKRRFSKVDGTDFDCVKSSYACGDNQTDDGSFISQDQVLALLFGFSFVYELMEDVVMPESDTTYSDYAALLTHRIVNYLADSKWRIRGPKGEKVSNRWGGDVRGFNNAIAKTANRMCGGKYRKNYHRGSSRVLGWAINGTMNWGFGLQAGRNKSMILESVICSGKWNSRKMAKRSKKSDKVMYALAYSIVHNKALHKKIKRKEIEDLLNTAPIDGPCFGTPNCEAPNGWKSSDRWWHSDHKNGNPYGAHFEYSGIDYMLLYNLYHALYKKELDLPDYKKEVGR